MNFNSIPDESVGYLYLKHKTEVIDDFFGLLALGDGKIINNRLRFVQCNSGTIFNPTWQQLRERFIKLIADRYGTEVSKKSSVLDVLASYNLCFCERYKVRKELQAKFMEYLATINFSDALDISALFYLAKFHDDGHRLKKLVLNQYKPFYDQYNDHKLFHKSLFVSGQLCYQHSSNGLETGEILDELLAINHIAPAAELLFSDIGDVLFSIKDEQKRNEVCAKLIALLENV